MTVADHHSNTPAEPFLADLAEFDVAAELELELVAELERELAAEFDLAAEIDLVAEPDPLESRRLLREQIARLEVRLRTQLAEDPRAETVRAARASRAPAPAGPRVLDLGELERVRDDLIARVEAVRAASLARVERFREQRALLAAMYADPAAHRKVRLTAADLGEDRCARWRVRPVLGVVGRLMGWWRVRMSSGCP